MTRAASLANSFLTPGVHQVQLWAHVVGLSSTQLNSTQLSGNTSSSAERFGSVFPTITWVLEVSQDQKARAMPVTPMGEFHTNVAAVAGSCHVIVCCFNVGEFRTNVAAVTALSQSPP